MPETNLHEQALDQTVGGYIERLRLHYGISRGNLATTAQAVAPSVPSLSETAILEYETGQRVPELFQLKVLLLVLSISGDEEDVLFDLIGHAELVGNLHAHVSRHGHW